MSVTFSTNVGSVLNLKLRLRWGCSRRLRQIRCTVMCPMPRWVARVLVLQCVLPGGGPCRVVLMTRSSSPGSEAKRWPRPGASSSPARSAAWKRCRHLTTVGRLTLSSAAMAWLATPLSGAEQDLGAENLPLGQDTASCPGL